MIDDVVALGMMIAKVITAIAKLVKAISFKTKNKNNRPSTKK